MTKNLEKEILGKIKSGKVKMIPKWIFVAEEVGLKTFLTFGLVGAGIGISMIGLFLEIYNPKELAEFGEIGRQLLVEDFPYLWLIMALGLGLFVKYLEPKIGNNYKKSSWFWLMATIVIIMILATVIFAIQKLLKV